MFIVPPKPLPDDAESSLLMVPLTPLVLVLLSESVLMPPLVKPPTPMPIPPPMLPEPEDWARAGAAVSTAKAAAPIAIIFIIHLLPSRSEERRVGKEWRPRWAADQYK